MTKDVRRRQLLGGIGAMATAGVLAGCSNGTGGGDGGGSGDGGSRATPSWPSYLDDAKGGESMDARGQDSVTVAVGPGGRLLFEPTYLTVDSGTEIAFEFESSGHNVKPESQPDGGGLDGTAGGNMDLVNKGETYAVTLETTGTYTYYCTPHESVGMKGGILVR